MKKTLLTLLSFIFLFSCNNGNNDNKNDQTISVNAKNLLEKIKYQPGDPFIETFKKSEFFKVSGLENHILETKEGTILSIPKGAFRDKNGNIVEKEVQIEITDIQSVEDQILSNITSQQGANVLKSGGSIYLNATHNGEQLAINEDSPIYIETTIKDPESDYLIFEGIRNEKGEMQWINPTPPKKHLIPVDLDELDFLPDGFQVAVENGMPFKNHKKADKKLVDSLYYSLKPRIESLNRNGSYAISKSPDERQEYDNEPYDIAMLPCKGIDPAAIKVIKTKKFSNTFIATRDFEKRLKEIRNSKRPELLDIYINNLNLNLSTCDSMVFAKLPKGSASAMRFQDFARENLGNVKNLPSSVSKLGEYYSKELKKTKERLEKLRNDYETSLDKKDEKALKIQYEYSQLLTNRLVYRLEKFGYEVKRLGWSNIAEVLAPLDKFTLDIVIENGSTYDYVNVYTLDKNIQSIFALTSQNKTLFNRGYQDDQFLLYKKLQSATAIVVAYKDGVPYYATEAFSVTPVIKITLSPKQVSMGDLKEILRGLDRGHKSYNKIQIDLEYQALFYKERVRKEKLMKEREFINTLVRIAFDCIEQEGISEVPFDI